MTDDEIVYLIHEHYATSGDIFDVIIFARAIEHCTLTKQKARWYHEGVEAGLRQALAKSPKPEWVGLTDEELHEHARWDDENGGTFYITYGRSIEAKLKHKNNA